VIAGLRAFAEERLAEGLHRRPLVVSSNGVLRFLPRLLLDSAAQLPSFKMRTGHLGLIQREAETARLGCWDVGPDFF
jgi:hypothetical protein